MDIAAASVASYAGVAVVAGAVAVCVRRRGRADAADPPAGNWSLAMVAVAFAVLALLPDLIAAVVLPAGDPMQPLTAVALTRRMAIKLAFAPACAALAAALFARIEGVGPRQLGLTTAAWGRDLWLGYRAWLAATVGVSLLSVVTLALYARFDPTPPKPHPILDALHAAPLSAEALTAWAAATLAVALAAPLTEELLFRGIVQPWLRAHPGSGGPAFVAAALFGAFVRTATGDGWRRGLAPVAFVVVLALAYAVLAPLSRRPDALRGVYLSATLFALVHSPVWPTPIPLFTFALVLGWLYERTGRLTACVALHGLFNATTMIQTFLLGT